MQHAFPTRLFSDLSSARLAGGNRPHSYRARSLLACRFRSVAPRAINSLVLPGRPAYVMEHMKALADDLPDMGGPAIAKANRPGFLVDGKLFRSIAVAIFRVEPRPCNDLFRLQPKDRKSVV